MVDCLIEGENRNGLYSYLTSNPSKFMNHNHKKLLNYLEWHSWWDQQFSWVCVFLYCKASKEAKIITWFESVPPRHTIQIILVKRPDDWFRIWINQNQSSQIHHFQFCHISLHSPNQKCAVLIFICEIIITFNFIIMLMIICSFLPFLKIHHFEFWLLITWPSLLPSIRQKRS